MKRTLFLLLLATAATVNACLWDSDTIMMEKARFPGIAEIMTGRFPRHSPAYYEWRMKGSETRIKANPKDADAYDDLAVAQHKLGDHRAALATMQQKEVAVPGRYETYSNMGTFYIYTGELKEALVWIDKALAINSNAHFGRERYQRWLVEWVLAGKQGAAEDGGVRIQGYGGFADFVRKKTGSNDSDWEATRRAALGGIAGMMRFADFDNPLLQEALGDVLASGKISANASLLAAQAYTFALQRTKGNDRERLERKSALAMETHDQKPDFQSMLKTALAAGRELADEVARDEKAWIAAGANVQAEFEKKYLRGKKE